MKQNTLLCFLILLAACTSKPNENKNENNWVKIITQNPTNGNFTISGFVPNVLV